jgi:hypothetical protein
VGYYTPSGPALSLAAPGFACDQDNTTLLGPPTAPTKGSTFGDLPGKTISAAFHVSDVTETLTYFGEPSSGGTTANARLSFQADNGGGFQFMQFWWSDVARRALQRRLQPDRDSRAGRMVRLKRNSRCGLAGWVQRRRVQRDDDRYLVSE